MEGIKGSMIDCLVLGVQRRRYFRFFFFLVRWKEEKVRSVSTHERGGRTFGPLPLSDQEEEIDEAEKLQFKEQARCRKSSPWNERKESLALYKKNTSNGGMILLWDVDAGLAQIDKYFHSNDNHVIAGALLEVGVVKCGIKNDCDPPCKHALVITNAVEMKHGPLALVDENLPSVVIATRTKGGSSGSPVVDWQGRAIALNAGSKSSSALAFFLPLERKGKYSFQDKWEAVTIPRGTLQTTFIHKGVADTTFDWIIITSPESEIEKEMDIDKMDDETESLEHKEEHGLGLHTADIVMEENAHGDDVNQSNEKDEDALEAGNELVGVICDENLLELLELEMSSNTAETVKRARELMELGVYPMVFMSQMATLIMDIIAGTCQVIEASVDSLFEGRSLTEAEIERLKHALKLLSESEKQLRLLSERSTWFTTTLLQLGSVPSADPTPSGSSRTAIVASESIRDTGAVASSWAAEIGLDILAQTMMI
ncbi:hypothetical protein Lser_V15G38756 [Lactuca serriola]